MPRLVRNALGAAGRVGETEAEAHLGRGAAGLAPGEDRDSVLSELGLTAEQIEGLRRASVLG